MDWDKLRIFHTVAQAESFTGAGEILNLSQSAVSRQISTLEESLGVTLFHRHARGLLLTEQGEILLQATDGISKKLQIVEGKLADTRQLPEGPLIVTVSDFLGTTWLAPRLNGYREEYPGIQLTILFDERIFNISMREADAAIRLHRPKDKNLIARKLTTINFHICASKTYFEKNGKPESIKDLKDHFLISFPRDSYSPINEPGWLLDLAQINIETSNNVLLMNSMYAIHKAAQTNVGIAVLPDYLIHANPNFEIILPEYQRPSTDMYFVYAEERRNSKRISTFRDFLLKTIEGTPF